MKKPTAEEKGLIRGFMFKVEPDKGEYIYGMYVGNWLKDSESDSKIRYCMAGKKCDDFRIHFILFVQIKGDDQNTVIIDEGKCNELDFRRRWRKFRSEFKKNFGEIYRAKFWKFYEMEDERRDMLFNSIITDQS